MLQQKDDHTEERFTSSSATTDRPRCRVGQFWPKVEEDIQQTIQVYLKPL